MRILNISSARFIRWSARRCGVWWGRCRPKTKHNSRNACVVYQARAPTSVKSRLPSRHQQHQESIDWLAVWHGLVVQPCPNSHDPGHQRVIQGQPHLPLLQSPRQSHRPAREQEAQHLPHLLPPRVSPGRRVCFLRVLGDPEDRLRPIVVLLKKNPPQPHRPKSRPNMYTGKHLLERHTTESLNLLRLWRLPQAHPMKSHSPSQVS